MINLSEFLKKNKIKILFVVAALFFICSALLGIAFGSVDFNLNELLFGSGVYVFMYVRLPRVLACVLTGSALSVSGCIIQSVLSNRLASPGIIGVNSGAGLLVTIATACGMYGGWQTALSSFIGAFGAALLLTLGASRWGMKKGTVILMGVAMNSFFGAISSAIVTLCPDVGVMSNDFKVGDFSGVTYSQIIPSGIVICVVLVISFLISNSIDVISLGDSRASSVGMNVKAARPMLLMLAALLAGCAVSISGLLSFVGLVIPHIVRMMGVSRSSSLMPLSALMGGGFVCICDLAARTMFAPYEVPVGIIMAFIGAPFFVVLLSRKEKGHA